MGSQRVGHNWATSLHFTSPQHFVMKSSKNEKKLKELYSKQTPINTLLQFSSAQLLSRVQFFATPGTTARQASLSVTNSWILLKFTSIELVMPSSHFFFCLPPSPPALNLSQHQDLFQWVGPLHQVTKVLELQFQQIDLFSTPSPLINLH